MQMVKKGAVLFGAIWFVVLIFMPKAEFYYAAEKKLLTQDIRLNEGSIEEGLFSLHIKDVTIYVKGIALAHIEELDFFTVLFYNSLEIMQLEVDDALHAKVPPTTKEAKISQHIFSPFRLTLDANGSFGVLEGEGNLLDKEVHIDFVEVKEIGMIQNYLQKNEKGWFYEKSF